jgi:adenylylsulfate kinase-like enzyme
VADLLDPVTVTIRGKSNTGKTTLASLIKSFLEENGYQHVQVHDLPPRNPEDKPRFMERFDRNRNLRPVVIRVELEG